MGVLAFIALVLGVVVFLLMEHTLVFWLVFVPLALLFVISTLQFFKSRGWGFRYFTTAMIALFAIIVVLLIVSYSDQCEHEDLVTWYSFSSESELEGTVRPYCRDCKEAFDYSDFKGELVDKSYLSAITEHSDGSEIVPGEYYTVTATVPLGYYGYGSDSTWLTCEVGNEKFIVKFYVEFREEFTEAVKQVEKGEEITFRGRFYDKGCGFTDCELLTK
jgi:hypothetical protein